MRVKVKRPGDPLNVVRQIGVLQGKTLLAEELANHQDVTLECIYKKH
jgi:hypothetical protein